MWHFHKYYVLFALYGHEDKTQMTSTLRIESVNQMVQEMNEIIE